MKTADITNLPPALAESLSSLESLREERMTLEDRANLLIGSLLNLAEKLCDTVTDWSTPRPVMPLSSWQTWASAHELVKGEADGCGDEAWQHACKALSDHLKYGYAAYQQDIA